MELKQSLAAPDIRNEALHKPSKLIYFGIAMGNYGPGIWPEGGKHPNKCLYCSIIDHFPVYKTVHNSSNYVGKLFYVLKLSDYFCSDLEN